jgi:pimeloyl-ACP methyl ester carboxylesterase
MKRRQLLKAATSSAAGLGLFTSMARATTPKRSASIDTSGRTNLYHRDWGTGKPVLFVHGWALNCDMWQYQMVHLAERGFRTIAYDNRGHGRSSDPGHGFDFDTLADDLASVIEQLDLRDAVLVGHSMGAGQVVRYLTRHGASRVHKALLLAPSMKAADNPDGVGKQRLDKLRASLCADLPKWLAGAAPSFFTPETSPETVQWGIRMCLQTSLKTLVETNRADVETDFRAELQKISTKMLIIHGDRDHSAPLDLTGRWVAQLIRGSEFKVYEGAPHGLFITHMDRLNRDLVDFASA